MRDEREKCDRNNNSSARDQTRNSCLIYQEGFHACVFVCVFAVCVPRADADVGGVVSAADVAQLSECSRLDRDGMRWPMKGSEFRTYLFKRDSDMKDLHRCSPLRPYVGLPPPFPQLSRFLSSSGFMALGSSRSSADKT